jgi:hypothetical protein
VRTSVRKGSFSPLSVRFVVIAGNAGALPHLREIQHNAKNPILKKVWSQWGYAFDDQFRKLMDDTLSKDNR